MKVLNLTLNGIDAENYLAKNEQEKIIFVAKHTKQTLEKTAKLLGYEYKCEGIPETIKEVDFTNVEKSSRARSPKKRKPNQDS